MDKTVKFRVEIESNGQKVLHSVTASTEELRKAIGDIPDVAQRATSSLSNMGSFALALNSSIEVVGRLQDVISGIAQDFNAFDKERAKRGYRCSRGKWKSSPTPSPLPRRSWHRGSIRSSPMVCPKTTGLPSWSSRRSLPSGALPTSGRRSPSPPPSSKTTAWSGAKLQPCKTRYRPPPKMGSPPSSSLPKLSHASRVMLPHWESLSMSSWRALPPSLACRATPTR